MFKRAILILLLSFVLLAPLQTAYAQDANIQALTPNPQAFVGFPADTTVFDSHYEYVTGLTSSGDIYSTSSVDEPASFVKSLPGATKAILSPYNVGYALKADGSLWSWGNGFLLGRETQMDENGNNADDNQPAQITGIPQIKDVSTGANFTIALAVDGTVWAWGDNSFAQLGIDTNCPVSNVAPYAREDEGCSIFQALLPVQLPGLEDGIKISAGASGAIIATSGGDAYQTGGTYNIENNDFPYYSTPSMVVGLPNVIDVGQNTNARYALTDDGHVYAWGHDPIGLDLAGYAQNHVDPVELPDVTQVKSISVSLNSTAVIVDANNDVYAWGTDDAVNKTYITHLSTGDYSLASKRYVIVVHPISVDNTSPQVIGIPDRAANNANWYNAPVTITWTATDPSPSSGAPTTPVPTTANLQGTNAYTSGQSCDPAGNCATGSLSLSIDSVLPSGNYIGGNGAIIRLLGQKINGTAADTTSGVVRVVITSSSDNKTLTSDAGGAITLSCNAAKTSCTWVANPATLNSGRQTLTLKITDLAGNTYTVSKAYTII